jgi:hypothetical protein
MPSVQSVALWAALPALALSQTVNEDKAIPLLPDSFSSVIEASITEKNYTIEMKETYDYDNNRFRIERHDHDRSTVELCNFATKKHVVVEGDGVNVPFDCNVTDIAAAGFSCMGGSRGGGGHIQPASSFLEGTDRHNYTYMGTAMQRGIMCDSWKASADMPAFRPGRPAISYDLTWYFAVESWKVRGRDTAGVMPVLALLEGEEKDANTGAVVKPFTHYYSFVNFWPEVTDTTHGSHMFDLDPAWKCEGGPPAPVSCGEGTTAKDGKCVCTSDISGFVDGQAHTAQKSTAAYLFSFLPGLLLGWMGGTAVV